MASELSLLSQLAADISKNAAKLDEYLKTNNLPQPGFGVDAPLGHDHILKDPEAARAKAELTNAGRKLYFLMLGHVEATQLYGINVESSANFRRQPRLSGVGNSLTRRVAHTLRI
jgi:hypothetical protein